MTVGTIKIIISFVLERTESDPPARGAKAPRPEVPGSPLVVVPSELDASPASTITSPGAVVNFVEMVSVEKSASSLSVMFSGLPLVNTLFVMSTFI